jgi:hypothetical protein
VTHRDALDTARELGDRRAEGSVNYNLGVVARDSERFDEALEHVARARDAWRDAGNDRGLALVDGVIATIRLRMGDRAAAREHATAALMSLAGTGYTEAIVEQLETIAMLDVLERGYCRAARLIGQADRRRGADQMVRPPLDQRDIDRAMSVIREHLGADTDGILAEGERLSLDAAALLALERRADVPA